MTPTHRRTWLISVTLCALLAGTVPALSQLDYDFMPKGGKTLLIEVLGTTPDSADLSAILSARRSEAEWHDAIGARAKALSEREQKTLTAYLAINMPMRDSGQIADKAGKPDELQAVLPRDGRDLAWNECQYCHSLFTSYLTQDRGMQAWLNMFESPFHRGIKMTAQERQEFSQYSTINMPMKIEDVPEDLRF